MDARQVLTESPGELAPEWFGAPGLAGWEDLPPEAYEDDLGLGPEDWAAWRAELDAGHAEDEAVTAAVRAGTLPDGDEACGLIEAAAAAYGDPARMSDADLMRGSGGRRS